MPPQELFDKGCKAGDARSCGALGEVLLTKSCIRDKHDAKRAYIRAIALSRDACFSGNNPHRCWDLGIFLMQNRESEVRVFRCNVLVRYRWPFRGLPNASGLPTSCRSRTRPF